AKDAAELEAAARQKLASKKCDAIVANDVSESAVFGKSHASVLIAHANGSVHAIHDANKLDIAQHVCDLLVPAAQ
ncbi:MAG: bifunctional 4'-phosphopantothenoylcysteine decarboxylase/phosphopantothenoylcysteine synthetase, partial [Actinobacteria bacterium]|nr:bifunctional 4'-phosphopantothenoylcysteine decarboxylase/phosphopantothenoylcysteine synthetase [Actinomycetota bacterium]